MPWRGLRVALDEILLHYSEHRERYSQHAPFSFGPTVARYRDRELRNAAGKQLEQVTGVVQAMQRALRVMALGIDYAQYAQFDLQTPQVDGYFDGRWRYCVDGSHESLTDEDYRLARLFVIQSALQAARADAVLQQRSDRNARIHSTASVGQTPQQREWTGPTAYS
jgi:hypothetical protein